MTQTSDVVEWFPRAQPSDDTAVTHATIADHYLLNIVTVQPSTWISEVLSDSYLQSIVQVDDQTWTTYVNHRLVVTPSVRNNPWVNLSEDKLTEVRRLRLLHLNIIRNLVNITDALVFRDVLDSFQDQDTVRHYWLYHNPYSRLLVKGEPLQIQGFNVSCHHIDQMEATVASTTRIPQNSFLTEEEDTFLYFATILFEDVGCQELANQVCHLRSTIIYFGAEVQTLLQHCLLDPLIYFDHYGIRKADSPALAY